MKSKLSTFNFQLSTLLLFAAFLAPLTMRADTASKIADYINGIKYTDYGTGKFTATASGNTVTVSGSFANNSAYALTLNIDTTVTVLWLASATTGSYNSGFELINLSGSGMFEVDTGGEIKATPTTNRNAIKSKGVTIKINGGTVVGNGTDAIYAGNGAVTVTAGSVNVTNGIAINAGSGAKVTVSGGTVNSSGSVAISTYNGTLGVSGGMVSSSASQAINASGSAVTVSGGEIISSGGESICLSSIAALTVSGTGQVEARDQNGIAIHSYGNNSVEVKDNAQISAILGAAILAENSATSTVTIGGSGKVQSSGDYTIRSTGNVVVKDNAQVISNAGTAISADGAASTVTISGGTVSATTGTALFGADIAITGGTVGSTDGRAIWTGGSNDKVSIGGTGIVKSTSATLATIDTYGSVEVKDNAQVSSTSQPAIYASSASSTVTVSGGTVEATTGNAIYTPGASSKITVSGGLAFAYGSSVTGSSGVIRGGSFTTATGAGVVVAWDQGMKHTTYTQGTSDDISWSPASATATWDIRSILMRTTYGIYYANGTNTGFIALPVTVTEASLSVSPTSLSFTASGGTQTLSITSNAIWAAGSSDTTWLKVSPTRGQNSGKVTVTADPNTTAAKRTATITVLEQTKANQTISVTQDAAPVYKLTVNSGAGSGNYTEGTPVPVTANAAPTGKTFDKWTGDVKGLADATKETSIFTMGRADATITATYKDSEKTAIESVETSSVTLCSQDGDLIVKSDSQIQNVNVYNLSGQLLKTVAPGSNYTSIPLSCGPSVLIVKVVMSDGETIIRKIIKK